MDRIDPSMHDRQANHSEQLQKLRRDYNGIVSNLQNDISTPPSDIVDMFPSEVWIQIVKDALPVRGYSFALLLLTMVSNKWLRGLVSVPTLWASIDLRGSQEDSLATIETFKQLSGGAAVHLSIYLPTHHDYSMIWAILAGIGLRLHEATIRLDTNAVWITKEAWEVTQLLLTASIFNSNLSYIQMEPDACFPLSNTATQLIMNNPLPPSLRAIRGWSFSWCDFQRTHDFLERVEAIDSLFPIEDVLSHRIPLPNLRSLKTSGVGTFVWRFRTEYEEGFPPLGNLTSLVYKCSYRQVFIQLIHSVAPKLVHLELRVPYSNIPLLAAALQTAICLRKLAVDIEERGDDEGVNKSDLSPVYHHTTGEAHGLRDLTFRILPGDYAITSSEAARRSPFLNFLMSMISKLYTQVERLELVMETEYPIAFEDALLSYVSRLPELRTLRLHWPSGGFSATQNTYPLGKLEYLDSRNMDFLQYLDTPNLLSLKVYWGWYGNLEALQYGDLRSLFVTWETAASSTVDLPESCFPSLQKLTLFFNLPGTYDTYGSLKLTSFQFLTSVTISGGRYEPQGTMLCFALLDQPDKCPALNEIKFLLCFPDWDILFLMLEKRNFMMDPTVSIIRRLSIPFIPSDLRTPLASLLRGVSTERPPNNELFMGGTREILLDEQVPGCFSCLLSLKGGCKYPVKKVREVGGPLGLYGHNPQEYGSMRFAWTENPEYGDPAIVEWVVQRKLLLSEFLLKFAKWGEQYRRGTSCMRGAAEMEITEHGVISGDSRSHFSAFR